MLNQSNQKMPDKIQIFIIFSQVSLTQNDSNTSQFLSFYKSKENLRQIVVVSGTDGV
jgi:hypothetical protein